MPCCENDFGEWGHCVAGALWRLGLLRVKPLLSGDEGKQQLYQQLQKRNQQFLEDEKL